MNNKIHKLFWFITSMRWNNTEPLQWLMPGQEHRDMFTCGTSGQHARTWLISWDCSRWSEDRYWSCALILEYHSVKSNHILLVKGIKGTVKKKERTYDMFQHQWKCYMICIITQLNIVNIWTVNSCPVNSNHLEYKDMPYFI